MSKAARRQITRRGRTPQKARTTKVEHARLLHLPLHRIRPSPENDRLYAPVDTADPEIVALSKSIQEHGVQEPLLLTRDGYILSGHRRYAAARLAGLGEIPCRIRAEVSRAETPDLFLRLLRECNRQRTKTAAEKVREEVVSVNPEESYQALIDHRRQKSSMPNSWARLDLGELRERKKISRAREPMLNAALAVLEDRREFWPLSDRQIHYALLNDPPLVHASKPASVYRNDLKSYNALTDLLTRARLAGKIPFEAIGDETRPVQVWPTHRDIQGFLRSELNDLLKGYWRDMLQSQPNHIELMIEKNTVLSILKDIAARYCIPITSGRGFCSLPPRHDIACRFKKSGKERLVLLMVGFEALFV